MKQCQPSLPSIREPVTSTSAQQKQDSSGDSGDGGNRSDPKTWFDQFNQNPSANLDGSNAMDGESRPARLLPRTT